MIPIWAKNREGKWEVLPVDLLETLPDGKLALKIVWLGPSQGMATTHVGWMHLFVYDTSNRRWVLNRTA